MYFKRLKNKEKIADFANLGFYTEGSFDFGFQMSAKRFRNPKFDIRNQKTPQYFYFFYKNKQLMSILLSNFSTIKTISNIMALDKSNTPLVNDLISLIEEGKKQLAFVANATIALTYWRVGKRINTDILDNKRGDYGKQIVVSAIRQLVVHNGSNYERKINFK